MISFRSVKALSGTDKPFFKLKDAQEYMNCALVNLQARIWVPGPVDGTYRYLRSRFSNACPGQNKPPAEYSHSLVRHLFPITLLAGIWGMNFEIMPELGLSFGYPLALGLMALIGTGMFLFFRKGGWFD